MSKAKEEINREYVSKGVSATPEWWQEVDRAAAETGMGRSTLIRVAVLEYLKGDSGAKAAMRPAMAQVQ